MVSGAHIRIIRLAGPEAMGGQLERPVNNLTGHVAQRMHRLVPKDSWRLDETIEAQPAKTVAGRVIGWVTFGGKVVRGKLVNYHLMVERGTSKMRAQPYARPALYQSRSSDLKTRAGDA